MIFSSLEFIFIFLPIFLTLYFIMPVKYRNYILLIGSCVFYIIGTWGHFHYIILLICIILFNYVLGKRLSMKKDKKILVFGIAYNLIWLILFKYSKNLLLPIGISFYTFQSISYLVDIYNGKNKAENSIIRYAMYVLMFPQLVSGPIVTYNDINKQLEQRKHSLENIMMGFKYFITGLGFKVLLANRIACLWNDVNTIGFESISTGLAWLGIIGYSLQVYFDFCGYSLMAIGLGRIMGFKLPVNFKTPYLSTSMTDFFRRWHISLGNWFKNYIYIPLGGNRKGKIRTILNLLVVWLLTGVWHGANYNFILWGLFVFLIITIEKIWLKPYLDKYKVFGHLYMLILIPIMWLIFAIPDIKDLIIMFNKLFTWSEGLYLLDFIKYTKTYGILIIVGILSATRLPYKLLLTKKNSIFTITILLLIFVASVYYLYIGLNNPFLYFSF